MQKAVEHALGFIESATVRAHLKTLFELQGELSTYWLCGMVEHARASLHEKAQAFQALAQACGAGDEDGPFAEQCAKAALYGLRETENTPPGSVFLVISYGRFDPSDDCGGKNDCRQYGLPNQNIYADAEVHATFEQAVKSITSKYLDESGSFYPIDDDCRFWNEICRYDRIETGALELAVSWYVGESGVVWDFRSYLLNSAEGREEISIYDDFHVPTPFLPGDIVTVDCRPFYPVFHAVVLENKYPRDCCSLQVAFLGGNRRIQVGELTHWRDYATKSLHRSPQFSPFYRLDFFHEKLPRAEACLHTLSEMIKRSPNQCQTESGNSVGDRYDVLTGKAKYKKGVSWKRLKAALGA